MPEEQETEGYREGGLNAVWTIKRPASSFYRRARRMKEEEKGGGKKRKWLESLSRWPKTSPRGVMSRNPLISNEVLPAKKEKTWEEEEGEGT